LAPKNTLLLTALFDLGHPGIKERERERKKERKKEGKSRDKAGQNPNWFAVFSNLGVPKSNLPSAPFFPFSFSCEKGLM
jgi:hypothetical protein